MQIVIDIPDDFYKGIVDDKYRVHEGRIFNIIRNGTPLPKEKWIPVSERLPKAGEYVGEVAKYYLVQNEYGDMLVARYTHSEYWEQIYQLKPYSDRIVAWRELPESYKEESEDRNES